MLLFILDSHPVLQGAIACVLSYFVLTFYIWCSFWRKTDKYTLFDVFIEEPCGYIDDHYVHSESANTLSILRWVPLFNVVAMICIPIVMFYNYILCGGLFKWMKTMEFGKKVNKNKNVKLKDKKDNNDGVIY